MAAKKQATEKQGKVYGYARISTDKQDTDRQEIDIFEYAAKHGMIAPAITVETVSSRKGDRRVFELIDRLEKGDVLIVTELSRLARSMFELNGIIAKVVKEKSASIHVANTEKSMIIDDSDDMQSYCIVFAMSVAAKIERDMISERTKSALKARKAEGVKLGRPEGKGVKVDAALKEKGMTPEYISGMKTAGLSNAKIAKLIGLDARTVGAWLKERPMGK